MVDWGKKCIIQIQLIRMVNHKDHIYWHNACSAVYEVCTPVTIKFITNCVMTNYVTFEGDNFPHYIVQILEA